MPREKERAPSSSPEVLVPAKDPAANKTKGAVAGLNGYDAQAAALVPPAPAKPVSALDKDLKSIQERLNTLGFPCGKPDGIMGPKTRGAIVAFQAANGLTPDGIVGPMTQAALVQGGPAKETPAADKKAGGAPKETPDVAPAPPSSSIVTGGPQLKAAQEALNKLGLNAGTPDGVMGPKTRGALEVFQKTRGLATTGTLDMTTQDKLSAAVAALPPAPAKTDAPAGDKAGAPPAKDKDKPPAGAPPSGARQAVAAAAMAEVGKVHAKQQIGKDEAGKAARGGWDRLVEYFDVAFGGAWKDTEILKRPRAGTKLKHGTTTGERVEVSDTLMSWCGIFTIWAVKTGGMSAGSWTPGTSAQALLKGRSKVPQVGDVVISSNNNHHALVVWVAPDAAEKVAAGKASSVEVKTVDGNSGSNPVSGGEVVDKGTSTMAKWNYGAWSPD